MTTPNHKLFPAQLRDKDATDFDIIHLWDQLIDGICKPARLACESKFYQWALRSDDLLDGDYQQYRFFLENVMRTDQ